jgi:hypothetical protein
MTNSANQIVETLDRHLSAPTGIVVFGAAALLLDEKHARHLTARQTNDVDIIIPASSEMKIDADMSFWSAIEATNKELEPTGLYISHIFPEREVALTPEWQNHVVELKIPNLEKLKISRPRVLDLVVSKMGRGDPTDLEDVRQMLRIERLATGRAITADEIAAAAARANVPTIYQGIFPQARDRIVQMMRASERMTIRPFSEQPRQNRGYRPGL